MIDILTLSKIYDYKTNMYNTGRDSVREIGDTPITRDMIFFDEHSGNKLMRDDE
jgi:hypothetical protein